MVLELLIALFYWNSTDCENAAPPPIHNLDCTLECAAGIQFNLIKEKGKFLDMDIGDQKSVCSKCPKGSTSLGGGVRFSSLDANWDTLPPETELICGYESGTS